MTETETKPKKKTARVALLERLQSSEVPLAVHEMNIIGHSENALATELSIMALDGLVVSRYRKGFRYKEWTTLELCNKMKDGAGNGFSLHLRAAS